MLPPRKGPDRIIRSLSELLEQTVSCRTRTLGIWKWGGSRLRYACGGHFPASGLAPDRREGREASTARAAEALLWIRRFGSIIHPVLGRNSPRDGSAGGGRTWRRTSRVGSQLRVTDGEARASYCRSWQR